MRARIHVSYGAGSLLAAALVLLATAGAAQGRKVLVGNSATTAENTSLALNVHNGPLQVQQPGPGPAFTSNLTVDPDGSLSASGSTVQLLPNIAIADLTVDHGPLHWEFTGLSSGTHQSAHTVVDQLTGSVDPFTGAMALHVRLHMQLTLKACATFSGSTECHSYTGDQCTIGDPSDSTAQVALDPTSATSGALTGTPYSEADGGAQLVDGSFSVPAPQNCSWPDSLGDDFRSTLDQELALPAGIQQSTLALGVKLDPIAQRGVIAALSAAPAGPLQATIDASATQAPSGVASWAFDLDGNGTYETTSAGPITTASFASAGTHTVGVRVTDVDGDADTAQATVTVSAPPPQSAPSNLVTLGRPKLNKKKGTAKEPVTVPGPGELTLTGKGVVAARPGASASKIVTAGTQNLLIKAKGKAKQKLNATGKAKVQVTITFSPTGGSPSSTTKTIGLKKTLHAVS